MVMPMVLLEKSLDKRITIVLKDSRILEGILKGFDEYMNMVLEETKEKKVESEEKIIGTVVLRGNNVVSIYPTSEITYSSPLKVEENPENEESEEE